MEKAQQARKENDIGAAKDAASLKATNLIQEYMDKKYVQNDSLNGKTTGQYVAEQMNGKTEGNYKFEVEGTTLKVLDTTTEEEIVGGTILDNGNIDWSSTGNSGNTENTGDTDNEEDNPPVLQTIESKRTAPGGTVQAVDSTANTTLEDDLGNEVIIPAGFGIASDSGTKVEEGIVIEDATNGNQFVWVPVGTNIKVSTTISATGKIDIPLSRYEFDEDDGTPTARAGDYAIDDDFIETEDDSAAINITDFINKTNTAKGYYIGRFEAGIEGATLTIENDVGTWEENSSNSKKVVCKKNATVYNYIVRGDATSGAVKESRGMYNDKTGYISDLVNSYAWDTAIVFIEKCGQNSNYALQSDGTGDSPSATGTKNDEQCKINDMSGNVGEWTTEYSSSRRKIGGKWTDLPCVNCGGYYVDTECCTSSRDSLEETECEVYEGFRPILYILEI